MSGAAAPLPPYTPPDGIEPKLKAIFPVGVEKRGNVIGTSCARVVFAALYVGAVRGAGRWIAPRHFIWMGPTRAADAGDAARRAWESSPARGPDSWYAENSRELRDTVITKGLLPLGAMVEREIPSTSNLPRYALQADFAALFEPGLPLGSPAFDSAVQAWQARHLTPAARARVALAKQTAQAGTNQVRIAFPGGGGTVMPAGDSPAIIKAAIEDFAPRFLGRPVVIWVSDSKNKRHYEDAALQSSLKLHIDIAKVLPDLILVDVEPPGREGEFLVVFVEAVASEGPMDEQRIDDLAGILTAAGLDASHGAFVTAYLDKSAGPFRATSDKLAWATFAWFASQPDHIVQLHSPPTAGKLSAMLRPRGT